MRSLPSLIVATAAILFLANTALAADALGLNVTAVTSSTITVGWTAVGAKQVRLYVSPTPDASKMKLMATITTPVASRQITNLAANVDFFITLQEDAYDGSTLSQMVYARTKGGTDIRANKLDALQNGTALREVHTYGPNILEVVVSDQDIYRNSFGNNDGNTLQTGTWTITRLDGSTITVTNVYRNTLVTGQWSYTVGPNASYDDTVMDGDHHIFLKLTQNLGSEDILRIQGPLGLDVTVPFSDLYMETPVIQVNQVGYNPRATQRYAYVSGWMGTGGALSLANFPTTANVLQEPDNVLQKRSTAVLSSLPITVRSASDSDAGTAVNQIDLSRLPAAIGVRYRVQLPGVGVSWVTAVSEEAVLKAYYVVQRGLFINRWGADLQAKYTDWSRPQDQIPVYIPDSSHEHSWTADMYSQSTPKTNPRTLLGGHHDAGDFDERPMHTAIAEDLMRAYEVNPANFTANLNLPDTISGYSLPDILDEALWGIKAWETLQESDGGVRAGVETYRDAYPIYHTNQCPDSYWAFSRDADVTARAAGLFAEMSYILKHLDSNPSSLAATRAAQLQTEAVNAWNYASSHSARNCYMIYASGELFRLTGDTKYRTAFDSEWNGMGQSGAFSNFCTNQLHGYDYTSPGRAVPDYLLGYYAASGATQSIKNTIASQFSSLAQSAVTTVSNTHAHRNPRPSGYTFSWGDGTSVSRDLDTVFAELQLGGLSAADKQTYFNAMSLTADYILGCNPLGISYVTGLGTRRLVQPLHLDSLSFIKDTENSANPLPAMPGIPIYGPVDSLSGASYSLPVRQSMYPDITASSYPVARRYADARTQVVCAEFTVWESMAPDAEMFGMLALGGVATPASWAPGQPNHRNTLPGGMTVPPTVVNTAIFYNDSAFDGYDAAANAMDDGAIAIDKTALLPGGTATFANYTSYSKGINGIIVDIKGLPGTPTASDFSLLKGNNNTPSQWTGAAAAGITVRKGAGVNGSDRIELTWNDGTIQNCWLQITVKATANTGISSDYTFYFGNAVGETGNSSTSARVDSADVAAVRSDPHKTMANPATVTDNCDFNRDGRVSSADEIIARQNTTTVVTEVKLISVP